MRHLLICILLAIMSFSAPLSGQYWQQWVKYEMDVILNDEEKTLTATSVFTYVNNSPDTLDRILMNLYPNAFNEGTIAEHVWTEYGNSFDLEKGWTGIQVQKVSRDSTYLEYVIRDDTILDISLDEHLGPGDTLAFQMDWVSLIHPHIDRSGWESKQYDFAQWYPKFVVYDENGWHDDPFGDWGEFYGEFGDFTVHFDVPAEQVIGATGIVIDGDPGWAAVTVDTTEAWEEWVKSFREERGQFIQDLDSSDRRKVTFFAEDVHDFAWSCSQDFVYEHGDWNGKDVHVLYTSQVGEDWTRDAVMWGEKSLQWLSEKFGMYPWPQITLVKALLNGGMEYPMLVMDGYASEALAVHEIGHNWFYGIFGNDELDDAWLDEGFTTFQTRWYLENQYPDNDYYLTREYITQFEFDHLPQQSYLEDDLEKTIRFMQSVENEPTATHSYDFQTYRSYSYNAYEKGSLLLEMLRQYLGDAKFLAGMQHYFSNYALKHVNEDRFIKVMENSTGEELDWLFDQWLHTTTYVDYQLKDWSVEKQGEGGFRTQIIAKNAGGMFVPLSATLYGANGEIATSYPKDFRHRVEVEYEVETNFRPTRVYLDAENQFLDADRRDNDSKRKYAWRYDYKGWSNYPDDRNLYLVKPLVGYSDLAGLGFGLNLKQVYRHTDEFAGLALDHNFESGNPDLAFTFQKINAGKPFKRTWIGRAQTWRSMTYGSLQYEMNWSEIPRKNPQHYLTLQLEVTDAEYAVVIPQDAVSFTRLGLKYELQEDFLAGDFGFSMNFHTSPADLGGYGSDFSQVNLMTNWQRNFGSFTLTNRTNYLANSKATPQLIKSRISSRDHRSIYLDRLASSLQGIADMNELGSHYYLAGGGRMRGYADSMNVAMNYIWTNNLDLKLQALPLLPDYLKAGVFIDFGQASNNARNWKSIGDAGFGVTFKPSWDRTSWLTTLIRPFQVKCELSILRVENGSWINTFGSIPWVITISG